MSIWTAGDPQYPPPPGDKDGPWGPRPPLGKNEGEAVAAALFGPVNEPPPVPPPDKVMGVLMEQARRLDRQREAAQRKGRLSRGDTDATSFKNIRVGVLDYLAKCAAECRIPTEKGAHGAVHAHTGFPWRTVRDRYKREGKDAAAIVRGIIAENPI